MNKLSIVLATAVVVLATVSGALWHRLHRQTEQYATAHVQEAAGVRARLAEGHHREMPIAERGGASQSKTGSREQDSPNVISESPATPWELMRRDPELRELNRRVSHAQLRVDYSDAGVVLGLTPAETESLLQLLVEYQTFTYEDPDDQHFVRRDAAIGAALGQDRLQRFRKYEESLHVRQRMRQMRAAFESIQQPLSAEQFELLVAAAASARKTHQGQAGSGSEVSATGTKNRELAELKRKLRETEKVNHDVIHETSTRLTPAQLAVLQEALEQEATMLEREIRFQEYTSK